MFKVAVSLGAMMACAAGFGASFARLDLFGTILGLLSFAAATLSLWFALRELASKNGWKS